MGVEKKLREDTNIIAAQEIMEEARKLLTTSINPSNESVLMSSLNAIKVNPNSQATVDFH